MALPLVSCICLTTHPKRAAYLPDALRSFRAQTYPNKELLIINDGDPLESRAADVHVTNLPQRGERWTIGEKRNVGIRMARGEFLATWDDDDISLPQRLTAQVAFMLEGDADIALADKMHVANEEMQIVGECTRDRVFYAKPVMGSAMIRRSAVVAVGGHLPLDFAEDVQVLESMRLLGASAVIVMSECDWYVLRRHDDNVTLGFGETTKQWVMCGLRGPRAIAAQRAVDAIRGAR